MSDNNLSSAAPYLVIVIVVGVVALVNVVMNSQVNIQGAYTTPEEERVSKCIDTDPEGLVDKKGYTQIGLVRRDDYCAKGTDSLHQWYCKDVDSMVESKVQDCPYGCENGVCLSQQTYS